VNLTRLYLNLKLMSEDFPEYLAFHAEVFVHVRSLKNLMENRGHLPHNCLISIF
jgi:hypothetical protein